MHKLVLAATVAIAAAASVAAPAQAMTAGPASGIRSALDNTAAVEQVVYVCRHRYYSSRRHCWWRPSYRHWRWHRRYW